MKPKYEVADIFQRYGEEYKKQYPMTDNQHKVMAAITFCRTARLGGHSEVCGHCGTCFVTHRQGGTFLICARMFVNRDPTGGFTRNGFILHGIQISPDSFQYPLEG